jgi:glycosyltransferase involved in cell wall biosynthesis
MPLVIAGGSSYSDDYIQKVRAMAWEDARFIGSVPHEDMEELLSNCYAYVLPSVMEGLSISLLEAVSYGACIITTSIPENLEVVGDCALTFPVGDRCPTMPSIGARFRSSSGLAAFDCTCG